MPLTTKTSLVCACLLLAGCQSRAVARQCAALEARFEGCSGSAAAARDLRRHCEVALATSPEPADASPSLAELERRTLVDCAQADACAGLTACLARHGCRFVVTSPTDLEPKLTCTGS